MRSWGLWGISTSLHQRIQPFLKTTPKCIGTTSVNPLHAESIQIPERQKQKQNRCLSNSSVYLQHQEVPGWGCNSPATKKRNNSRLNNNSWPCIISRQHTSTFMNRASISIVVTEPSHQFGYTLSQTQLYWICKIARASAVPQDGSCKP